VSIARRIIEMAQISGMKKWSVVFGVCVMIGTPGCGPVATVPTVGSAPRPAAETKVELQVAGSKAVLAQIAAQRGKIVVVDSWATWCRPCKEEFPKLVQIYRDHAKDGVVCMSVSLDQVDQERDALAFLTAKGATFPNFLINEEGTWQDQWNIKAIPMVLVFGRDGKLARKFDLDDPDNQFEYADVEKLVQDLIRRGK
jgi:thiol-disulfide isomerase/thioredoxin